MVKEFDERTKLSFRRGEDALYIKFGGLRDTDPSRGITSGQLKLAGHVSFFIITQADQLTHF
jgi:hypothetical protein